MCQGLCSVLQKPYRICQVKVKVLVAQSGPTLCDPMDCSPTGSSVHGIFQASILEWVASSSSRGSNMRLLHPLHWQADSLPESPGKPKIVMQ